MDYQFFSSSKFSIWPFIVIYFLTRIDIYTTYGGDTAPQDLREKEMHCIINSACSGARRVLKVTQRTED